MADSVRIDVPPGAGQSTQWGEALLVRPAPASKEIVLNLSALSFVDPFFLLRLRGFLDYHASRGHTLEVVRPNSDEVCRYLSRMETLAGLDGRCRFELGAVNPQDRRDVLIAITRLREHRDSDLLSDQLADLYGAHFTGPLGALAEAFSITVSEMCDNATTHGASPCGAYVAAQRYAETRCVLAIGDLGVGIPEHMRRVYPALTDDGEAIVEATKELRSGTGDPHRGIGYDEVITAIRETKVPRASLRVRAGSGRFTFSAKAGREEVRRGVTVTTDPTVGTWIRLELATA